MHWIDWSIIVGLLIVLTTAAILTNRYTKSVADFLAANRCAGRYILSITQGMAGTGAITIIACFQMFYNSGFTGAWWYLIHTVVLTIILLSGLEQ